MLPGPRWTWSECVHALLGYLRREEATSKAKPIGQVLVTNIPLTARETHAVQFSVVPIDPEFSGGQPFRNLLRFPHDGPAEGHLVGEAVAALLSLCLRRRVAAVRMTGDPDHPPFLDVSRSRIPMSGMPMDATPLPPEELTKRFSHLAIALKWLKDADTRTGVGFLGAARLYQLSAFILTEDWTAAYSLLAGAVTAAATPVIKASDRKRFIQFVTRYVPPEFWTSGDTWWNDQSAYTQWTMKRYGPADSVAHRADTFKPPWMRPEEKIEPSDLPGVLEAVYTERSRYLHGGIGDARMVADNMERADLDIGKLFGTVKRPLKRGSMYRNSKGEFWLVDDEDPTNVSDVQKRVPSFGWFEHIVHDSLLHYVGGL